MGKALPDELNESPVVLHLEAEVMETVMEKVRFFQHNDQELAQLMDYLKKKNLPVEQSDAKQILVQAQKKFYVTDGVLW